jgi:hypothetical protein
MITEDSTQEEVIREAWIDRVHVDESGCFSTCGEFCDDCVWHDHWNVHKVPSLLEVKRLSKPFLVSSEKGKEYRYYAPTPEAIAHLIVHCPEQIEKIRNFILENQRIAQKAKEEETRRQEEGTKKAREFLSNFPREPIAVGQPTSPSKTVATSPSKPVNPQQSKPVAKSPSKQVDKPKAPAAPVQGGFKYRPSAQKAYVVPEKLSPIQAIVSDINPHLFVVDYLENTQSAVVKIGNGKKLSSDVFMEAVKACKEFGGKYHSDTRTWTLWLGDSC